MADIVPAGTKPLVRAFVELPYALYRGHPHWIPPLRRDEYRRLSPRHNPFMQHADIQLWIARDGGEVTGRIALIEDRLHNDLHRERAVWFGFFEARDADTAGALLGTVEQGARARGAQVVRGPVNPSLNESAGLLIDAFDHDPYVLMPYNPPEYAAFVEAAGYGKAKDLLAWDIDATAPLGERMTKVAERVLKRQPVTLRIADLRHFDRELATLQTIYRSAWSGNWGFVPPTDAEVRQLAVEMRPIVDPELVIFAEVDGRAVGCAVAIPDANQVLRRMNGRLLPLGILHFLRRRSIIDRVRVMLLGVIPELRRFGLYTVLVTEIHRRAQARGYRRAELSWTLEDNADVNAGIEAAGGRLYKTYRIYEKAL